MRVESKMSINSDSKNLHCGGQWIRKRAAQVPRTRLSGGFLVGVKVYCAGSPLCLSAVLIAHPGMRGLGRRIVGAAVDTVHDDSWAQEDVLGLAALEL